jgi:hypothetical protein
VTTHPHKGTEKEGKPFGGGWNGPQFVLTHQVPDVGGAHVGLERIGVSDAPLATGLWFRVLR